MKVLSYEEFIKVIPKDTLKVISKAIEIFQYIENKPLDCNTWINFNEVHQLLGKDSKITISLFLAVLLEDEEIRAFFHNTGIEVNDVYLYLDLDVTKLNIEELLFDEYKDYYNNIFKHTLYRIMERNKGVKDASQLIPEVIMNACSYKFDCGSDVITWFFKDGEITPEPGQHPAFLAVQNVMEARLKEVPNDVNKDNSVDSTDKSNIQKTTVKKRIEKATFFDGLGENLNCRSFVTDPAVGREQELKDLMVALIIPDMSAAIVGEAGTGKTALVEGLVYRINHGEVPNALKDKVIVKVNVNSLIAGTMFRGQFEERIENVLKEASKNPNIIIFFDEMHTVIRAGSCSSNLDLANILKPYLDRGEVKIIGATTKDEYEEYIMSDTAFKRRFERVDIKEPDDKMVADILNNIIPKLEKVTGVSFPYETIYAVELTSFLASVTNKKNRNHSDNVNNPDLAIKIFSKAFALANYENASEVKVEHIAESIRRSARLNEASRERLANILLSKFNSPRQKKECKIIEFPRR